MQAKGNSLFLGHLADLAGGTFTVNAAALRANFYWHHYQHSHCGGKHKFILEAIEW